MVQKAIERYGLKDFSQLIAQQVDAMSRDERKTLKNNLKGLTPKQILQLKSKIVTAAAVKAMADKGSRSDVAEKYYSENIAHGGAMSFKQAIADKTRAKKALQAQRPQLKLGVQRSYSGQKSRADIKKYFSQLNKLAKTAVTVDQYEQDSYGDATGVTTNTAAAGVLANLERQVELLLLMTCSVTHVARLVPRKNCTAIGDARGSGRLTRHRVRVR